MFMEKEEKLAIRLRDRWDINTHSPIDIFPLVLDKIKDLTLLWYDMDQSISGCCCKNDKNQIIMINSNHTKGRQNFTLAHELYHLFFDGDNNWSVCGTNFNNENEIMANNFASYFLLPSCGLEKFIESNNIKKWNLEDIIKCEQFFQISHHSMLFRLKNEDYISQGDFDKFKSSVKINAMNLGYDLTLYNESPHDKKFYMLGKLIPLVNKSYERGLISKGLMEEILIKNYRSDIVYNLKED